MNSSKNRVGQKKKSCFIAYSKDMIIFFNYTVCASLRKHGVGRVARFTPYCTGLGAMKPV